MRDLRGSSLMKNGFFLRFLTLSVSLIEISNQKELNGEKKCLAIIRYRGEGKVCFYPPPLFCPTKFVKSSDQCVEKQHGAGEKVLRSFFSKKIDVPDQFVCQKMLCLARQMPDKSLSTFSIYN